MEILSLCGTVAFHGHHSSSHLHMALSASTDQLLGQVLRALGARAASC